MWQKAKKKKLKAKTKKKTVKRRRLFHNPIVKSFRGLVVCPAARAALPTPDGKNQEEKRTHSTTVLCWNAPRLALEGECEVMALTWPIKVRF